MAKITRKIAKIFGFTAGTDQIAQFGSLNEGSPAFSTDPNTIQALSNWQDGWFQAVEDLNSPAIEDMNAVHYVNSYQIGYLMQQGIAEWNSSATYYIGSLVNQDGSIYKSIADNNLNNALSDPTKWALIGFGLNVRAAGAAGNGIADDTAAIQGAFNAASTAGGGSVYIPAGTYLHTGLTWSSGITVFGDGWTSILQNTSAVNHSISNSVTGAATEAFRIAHICLNHTGGGSAVDGIHIVGASNHINIDRVKIENAPRDGIYLQGNNTSNQNALYSYIESILVQAPGRHGMYVNGTANSGVLIGGRLDGGSGAGKYNLNFDDTVTGTPGSYPNAWNVTGVDLPGSAPAAGLRDNGFGNRYHGIRFESNTVDIFLDTACGNAQFVFTDYSTIGAVTDNSASRPIFVDKVKGITGIPILSVNGTATVTGNADAVEMTVKGNATQTNDLFNVLKSDNTKLFKVTNAGAGTFSGTVGATNVSGTTSGTNTGDQTITLTGNVTGSGTGSFATTIAAGQIVDSMVNASAAIAGSKLVAAASGVAGAVSTATQTFTGIKTFETQVIGHGTGAADDAAAGYIGEYIESLVTSETSVPSNGQWGDATSISLTAGDWNVTGVVALHTNGSTLNTGFDVGISTTTGNFSTGLSFPKSWRQQAFFSAANDQAADCSGVRFSFASTTIVYLKHRYNFSAGTPQYTAALWARRAR